MKAASRGGARYDDAQSEEDRHSAENGLWLCESCAALIDKNDGADFSVSDLRVWKATAEKAALERLYRQSESIKANFIDTLIYINVPRLIHHEALTLPIRRIPSDFVDGIPGDGYIAPELYRLRAAIEQLRFPALDWHDAVALVSDPTGLLVSFEGLFRTKNGPKERADRRDRDLANLSTAPHIYQMKEGLKFILPYDPKFVTTSTACVEFSAGQVRVGGFAKVKFRNGDQIVASPLVIGLASTPEGRALMRALSSR